MKSKFTVHSQAILNLDLAALMSLPLAISIHCMHERQLPIAPRHAFSMLVGASPSNKCFRCWLVTLVRRRTLRAFFFFSRASRFSITCRGAGFKPGGGW